LAFLLGAAAGAAVALLYAPQAGEKTRELLGEKAREGRRRATDFAAKATDTLAQGRDQVTNAIERGRDAFQQARRENA
jgi:gas vesicle protein